MARTAGDAALDFEMRMLLETKEAEASAARLEKSLGGVLNIFGSIGKAATGTLGLIAAAVKAPADLDNYLGSLNTKVTTMNGNLENYRKIMIEMETKQRKPGDLMFGFSPEDFQKVQMNFARGASDAEKYGKEAGKYQEQFGQGVGGLVKLIGMNTEEATQAMTSFHRELGITYNKMGEFSKNLGALNKISGMTAEQNKKLYRTVTSLGRAYGLTGDNAKRFVLDSVAVGSAISKIGLDAEEIVRKMNSVATGSEKGLIQSLLLGFKPGDSVGQLQAFQDQAKMITQRAAQAGEQFAPYLTKQLGDALGMGDFSVEEMQALANGQSIEKGGKTELVDVVDVLKDIQKEMGTPKAAEDYYTTGAQTIQQKITEAIGGLQKTFWDSFLELKQMVESFDIKAFFTKVEGWITNFNTFLDKINKFFGGDGVSSLTKLGIGAAVLAIIPSVLPAIFKFIASLGVKALGSMLGLAGQGATTVIGATGATGLAAGLATSVAAASVVSIIGTVLAGAAIGGIVGTIINWATDKVPWMKAAKEKASDWVVGKFMDDKTPGTDLVEAKGRKSATMTPEQRRAYLAATLENKNSKTPATGEQSASGAMSSPASGLAQAMAKQEGFFAKSSSPNHGQRNNNPGNIRVQNWDKVKTKPALAEKYAKMQGADGYDPTSGFLKFNDINKGWSALDRQLNLYARRGMTVEQMVGKYAPKEDRNDPKSYTSALAAQGFSPSSTVAEALKQTDGPKEGAMQLAQGNVPESATEGSEVKDTTTHGLLVKVASVLETISGTLSHTAQAAPISMSSSPIPGATGFEWTTIQQNNAAYLSSPAR